MSLPAPEDLFASLPEAARAYLRSLQARVVELEARLPPPPAPPDLDPTQFEARDGAEPDDFWGPDHRTVVLETGRPGAGTAAASDRSRGTGPPARYRVGGEIGRGGMGVILEGWDTDLGREVAIKVIRADHAGSPEMVGRFLTEARITGRLQHPGIVPVHELGSSPRGLPFFVMPLVRGQTLEQLLRHRPDPAADLPRLLNIFLQVCQAVAYAHGQGVIHRDLKPANVMVGALGAVKVMDWGLAKVLGSGPESDPLPPRAADPARGPGGASETAAGRVFGTPAYLSPEQAAGRTDRVDRRTDVFGLGCVLCAILTGEPPYTGARGRDAYAQAVACDLTDARARLAACPAPLALVSLVTWCLAPDVRDRPADAGVVAAAMTAHLQSDQRRAEQDLLRFFDLSLDLFAIATTDGRLRRVNENFPRLLGYTAAELTSRPFLEFVHPDDRGATVAVTAEMARGERCDQFVNRYRHADGHYLWLEWRARTVPEERAIYAVARDVTARVAQEDAHRRAEQSLLRLAGAVNAADVAVVSTTRDGTVRSWNPEAERLFGYRADEVVGRSVRLLLPPDPSGDRFMTLLTECTRVECFETVRHRKGGAAVPVSVTLAPVKDAAGAFDGALKIVRDLSHLKRVEAELAERARLAELTARTNSILSAGGTLRHTLQGAAELLVRALDAAFARIWTLNERDEVLELRASAGRYTHLDGPHGRVPVGRYKIGRIAQERKPHLTNAVVGDPRVSDQEWAVREGMVAFAGHPITIGDRVLGVMAVFARRPLSDTVIGTLSAVADGVALAIRNERLESENRELRARPGRADS
jgi:serine/threonine-protein kinase